MLPRPQPQPENSLLSRPPPPPLPATYKTKERKAPPPQPPEQRQAAVRCPRCDSSNTKFCYYNNYSLTQPRHFCKTCRRYWTKGGALRNVPIGGGCRKHKKSSRSSITAANSRLNLSGGGGGFFPDQMSGLKVIPPPAVEFQYFGSLSFPPRLISSNPQYQYSSDPRDHMINLNPNLQSPLPPSHNGGGAGGAMVLDSHTTRADSNNNSSLLGLDFNYPFTSSVAVGGGCGVMDDSLGGEINKAAENNTNTDAGSLNIASSIESLSSINQELHFKLQQQRLAMLYGDHVGASMEMSAATGKLNDEGSGQGRTSCIGGAVSTATARNTTTVGEKPQPMFFHNLETTANNSGRKYLQNDGGRHNHHHDATEWFFGGRNSDQNGARLAQNLHL